LLYKKKQKVSEEEKPYVPPMGDLSKVLSKPCPKLMLTNGSSAPGAAIKAARQLSTAGISTKLEGQSIFGGKLTYLNSGFSKQMGLESQHQNERKQLEALSVPTHWQAELHDKNQAKQAEQEMLRLEHAKLLAKIQKKKEANKVIKVDGPPPPPPGSTGSY